MSNRAGVSKPVKNDDVVVVGSVQNGSIVISNTRNRQKSKVVLEREKQMKALKQQFPRVDSMTIHDILSKVQFDVELAQQELKRVSQRKQPNLAMEIVQIKPKPPQSPRILNYEIQSANSEVEDDPLSLENKTDPLSLDNSTSSSNPEPITKSFEKVIKTEQLEEESIFIKEEPIDEFVDMSELPENKRRLLHFFQEASLEELKFLNSNPDKGLGLAQAVTSFRPFMSWSDLETKIKKRFIADLINIAEDMFDVQRKIDCLLEKAKVISRNIERAVEYGAGIVTQPKSLPLSVRLRKYHIEILNWLMVMHNEGVHGILNYTKGVGRMLQLIAFLALLKEQPNTAKDLPHLVIVPSNIIDSWIDAFKTYCPSLNVFLYHGTKEERAAHRLKYYKGELYKYEVILTTYTVVVHIADEREVFRSMTADYIIFDETDAAKNINIQLYDNLIKTKARRKLLITGGSLQGNPLELVSVLYFVIPSKFLEDGHLSENLLQKALRGNLMEGEFTSFEQKVINKVKAILQPFILQELKHGGLEEAPIEIDVDSDDTPEIIPQDIPVITIKEEIEENDDVDDYIKFTPSTTNVKEDYKIPSNSFDGISKKDALNQLSSSACIQLKKISNEEISKYQSTEVFIKEEVDTWEEEKAQDSEGSYAYSSSSSDYEPEPVRRKRRKGRGATAGSSTGAAARKRKRNTQKTPTLTSDGSNDSSLYSSVGKRKKSHPKNCMCCNSEDGQDDALSVLNEEIEKCLKETGRAVATRRMARRGGGRSNVGMRQKQSSAAIQSSAAVQEESQNEQLNFEPVIIIKKEIDGVDVSENVNVNLQSAAAENFEIQPEIIKTEVEISYEDGDEELITGIDDDVMVPVIKAEIAEADEEDEQVP